MADVLVIIFSYFIVLIVILSLQSYLVWMNAGSSLSAMFLSTKIITGFQAIVWNLTFFSCWVYNYRRPADPNYHREAGDSASG